MQNLRKVLIPARKVLNNAGSTYENTYLTDPTYVLVSGFFVKSQILVQAKSNIIAIKTVDKLV